MRSLSTVDHAVNMRPSPERIKFLTDKHVYYTLLYQECSDYVRPIGINNTRASYDAAYKAWKSDTSNPLFQPQADKPEARKAYMDRCDEVCRRKPKTIEDYYTIQFACYAGLDLLENVELQGFPGARQAIKVAGDVAAKEYCRRNPDVKMFPDISSGMSPQLPEHVADAFFPTSIGPHLVDEEICFRHPTTGDSVECKVVGYKKTREEGELYEIEYPSGVVDWVKPSQMKYMVDHPVE